MGKILGETERNDNHTSLIYIQGETKKGRKKARREGGWEGEKTGSVERRKESGIEAT